MEECADDVWSYLREAEMNDSSSDGNSSDESANALGSPDGGMDWEQQRASVAEERWRHHSQWCESLAENSLLNFENRRIALKLLINEAYRRCYRHAVSRGARKEELARLKLQWTKLGGQMDLEMTFRDNSATVLRKLSSMCVFIPERASAEYGENFDERTRRATQQRAFITQLRTRGILFDSS